MNYRPRIEQEISALRVRRTWYGKLVIQIRRHTKKVVLSFPVGLETKFDDAGLGPWRDANGNDAQEIAEVTSVLRPAT